jgi:hypothetical protein
MLITIILVLAVAPVFALSMLQGTNWPPEALMVGWLALTAAAVILWVVVDALKALKAKWSRFTSRPY